MANPGDELNLQFLSNTLFNGTSWYFNEVWLHHVDNDYKMKLSGGESGKYYGEKTYSGKIIVFIETYIITDI